MIEIRENLSWGVQLKIIKEIEESVRSCGKFKYYKNLEENEWFFSLFFFFFFLSLRARYNALPRVSQEWNTIFISVIRLVKNVNLNFTRVNKEQRLLSHCAG